MLLVRSMVKGHDEIVGIALFDMEVQQDKNYRIWLDILCSGSCTKAAGGILLHVLQYIVYESHRILYFREHSLPIIFLYASSNELVQYYESHGFQCVKEDCALDSYYGYPMTWTLKQTKFLMDLKQFILRVKYHSLKVDSDSELWKQLKDDSFSGGFRKRISKKKKKRY